ncbi:TPA: endonuclease [Legionella pneumophila]
MIRSALLLFLLASPALWAEPPPSFAQAKKWVKQLFEAHPSTLYCGCSFAHGTIDLHSCGMIEATSKKRAHRLEIEHVVAAEHFGQQFACWREPLCQDNHGRAFKGRKCCQKIDARFRQMEAELYNLWPAVGLVNQGRSNYRFGMVPQQTSYYGCPIKIDSKLRRVEPDDAAKGIVARASLFMAKRYQLKLSKAQRQLFSSWNRQFPPSSWEYTWAAAVAAREGYENPYISHWSKTSFLATIKD